MTDRAWEIYTLTDPRTLRARYVGVTHLPNKRLHSHLADARRSDKTHRRRWLRSLMRLGLRPIYLTLEYGTGSGWEARERYWIQVHRKFCNLVNGSDGGEGSLGAKHSEETKKRLSDMRTGKPVSAANKARLAKLWIGRKHKPETIEKMRSAHKGIGKSESHRKNLSIARQRFCHTPEYRKKMSDLMKSVSRRLRGQQCREQQCLQLPF